MDAFTALVLCCIAAEFARLPYFSAYGPPELISHRNIAHGVLLRYPPLPPPRPPHTRRGVTDDQQLTASAWFWFVVVGAPVATSLGGVAAVWRMKRRRHRLQLRAEVAVVEHVHDCDDMPPRGDTCSGYVGEGDEHELTIHSTKPPSTPVLDYVGTPPSVHLHTPKSPGSRRRVAPMVFVERESPALNAAPRE
jgi:hypothetical protein